MAQIAYTSYALAHPSLDSQPVMLLMAGQDIPEGPLYEGFIFVQLGEHRAYVPQALCSPYATANMPILRCPEPVVLSPEQRISRPAQIILPAGEPLVVLKWMDKFAHIRRTDGMEGFVPSLLLGPTYSSQGTGMTTLRQAVRLYPLPIEGSQTGTDRILAPFEPVILLGQTSHEMLVQMPNGTLGFLPAAQRPLPAESIIPIGPIDLGWMMIGFLWGTLNWYIVLHLLNWLSWFVMGIGAWVMFAIALLSMLAIVGLSRRYIARSFAIGSLLIALLYVSEYIR